MPASKVFVGFDRSHFRDITRSREPRVTPAIPAKRYYMRCKCAHKFEAGKYAGHVRASKHPVHLNDRAFMVDMDGEKHIL